MDPGKGDDGGAHRYPHSLSPNWGAPWSSWGRQNINALLELGSWNSITSGGADESDTAPVKMIGALIVIERDTGLKDWVETGIAIDGLVSAEQPSTFFSAEPTSRWCGDHTGDQVLARLHLPATTPSDKELGARHRAGLGITEQSDAVALIVSDETGIVSVAHNGALTRYLDEEKLRHILTELCAPPPAEGLTLNIWPWRSNK